VVPAKELDMVGEVICVELSCPEVEGGTERVAATVSVAKGEGDKVELVHNV